MKNNPCKSGNILKLSAKITRYAGIAQLVEQLIRNQQVGGSSPLPGSNYLSWVSMGYDSLKPFFDVPRNDSKRLKIGQNYIQNAYIPDLRHKGLRPRMLA